MKIYPTTVKKTLKKTVIFNVVYLKRYNEFHVAQSIPISKGS